MRDIRGFDGAAVSLCRLSGLDGADRDYDANVQYAVYHPVPGACRFGYAGKGVLPDTVVTGTIMPLAMVGFGPLADRVKIEYILIVTGILLSSERFS